MYTKKIFICPYYTSNAKGIVRCQGGNICLSCDEELREYYNKFCASENWQKCSIAASLTAFLERADNLEVKRVEIRRNLGWRKKKSE